MIKQLWSNSLKVLKREVFYQHHFKNKSEAISETVDYLENKTYQ